MHWGNKSANRLLSYSNRLPLRKPSNPVNEKWREKCSCFSTVVFYLVSVLSFYNLTMLNWLYPLLKIRGLGSKTQMLVKYNYTKTPLRGHRVYGVQGFWLPLQHFFCYKPTTHLLDNKLWLYDLKNRKKVLLTTFSVAMWFACSWFSFIP